MEAPRSRKRRRVESSAEPERAATIARVSSHKMATEQPAALQAPPSMTAMFEDFRSIITCKICFRLLYQPFTVACGHTYCYTCLGEWFGRNEDRRKTCPDCRTVIRQPPAPAYTVREITQKYIQQPGVLPEGETKEDHEQNQAEESAQVEADRSNGGLFKGIFLDREAPLRPVLDGEDGIPRCPYCTWEIEAGDGPICSHCGNEHENDGSDGDYGSADDIIGPYPYDHDSLDEEVEADDMYDDDVMAALHPDMAIHDGFETGGEAYYISSDQDNNEDLREIRRPHRFHRHFRDPPRRPIGRHIFELDQEHAQFSEMESEGDGEDLYPGDQIPVRRRRASTPDWGGVRSPPHPHRYQDPRTLSRGTHRMVESDEDEDESDSEGSLQGFVVDEEDEDGVVSDSEDDSSHISNHGDRSIHISINEEESGYDSDSVVSSEEGGRDSGPEPEFPGQISHVGGSFGAGRSRQMRRIEESESESEVESASDDEEDGPVQHIMENHVEVTSESGSEEDEEDEMPVRRRHRR